MFSGYVVGEVVSNLFGFYGVVNVGKVGFDVGLYGNCKLWGVKVVCFGLGN